MKTTLYFSAVRCTNIGHKNGLYYDYDDDYETLNIMIYCL